VADPIGDGMIQAIRQIGRAMGPTAPKRPLRLGVLSDLF